MRENRPHKYDFFSRRSALKLKLQFNVQEAISSFVYTEASQWNYQVLYFSRDFILRIESAELHAMREMREEGLRYLPKSYSRSVSFWPTPSRLSHGFSKQL